MAKKKVKTKPKPIRVARKSQHTGRNISFLKWATPFVYGISGAALFYFLNPILVFRPSESDGYKIGISIFCGLFAFFCSRNVFRRNTKVILIIGFASILFHVAANVSLTYEWVGGNALLNILAGTLTIPLAILWFFILKNQVLSSDQNEVYYSFRENFNNKYFVVFGLIALIIAGVLIFYKLGYYDIWEDENLVINAAIGMQEQGLDYLKDGYKRTWLHSLLISGFFDVFGVSEFTGRLPSALFGLLFVLICFYVYIRWFGIWSLAVLVPIVCLMNDKFLILFRYMRMYALLIPVFLLAIYYFYRTISIIINVDSLNPKTSRWYNGRGVYIAGTFILLFLLAHLHKLSMVVLPVLFISIFLMALKSRTKESRYVLFGFAGGCILLGFLAIVVRVDALKMFAQVYDKVFSEARFFPQYYAYMFDNGLPYNCIIMLLLAGLGLFFSTIGTHIKHVLSFSYLLIVISLLCMVYLIEGEGRDYRYIAHIVPFIIGTSLYIWFQIGQIVMKKYVAGWMLIFLMISSLQLIQDYKRVYVKHPWAPLYSVVYETLKSQYKPGEALFAHNVKTYYLDTDKLFGDHYYKVPNKKQYTLAQFKDDLFRARKGWIMWDKHKSHHWKDEVIQYIYTNFKLEHGAQSDDYGVDLFYFDETMIRN